MWMSMTAWAQQGASCQNPIPLGRDYNATISGAGSVWYVANTFDLPLTVRFYPTNNNDPQPEIQMDFSCTPGVYSDPIVCSYFCSSQSAYIAMPHQATPDRKTDSNGRVYYEVAMGEFYRNMLLSAGISYNVEVFVKVTYHSGGSINLTPDAEFAGCMDTDKWLLFGNFLSVAANDQETFFVAPYANWQHDSIRYIWDGPADATVAIGTTCDFEPLNALDAKRVDVWTMQGGGDTANHTNADIRYYMQYMNNPSNTAKGGMFYVKAVSSQPGRLKVERMPMTPPDGGATLLAYNTAAAVPANGFNTLYAMPMTWTEATLFSTPTDAVFRMYVGTTANFTKETAIATYQFDKTSDGHQLGLFANQMEALWGQTNKKYLYVRFECSAATTITPTIWTPSTCVSKITRIKAGEEMSVNAKSAAYYGLYYPEWVGGDLTMAWAGSSTCPVYFGDTCVFPTNASNARVIQSESVPKNKTYTIEAAEIAEWADAVDDDGFIYVRMYPTYKGKMTFTTTAPEETDPVPVVYPAATIAVLCDGEPTAAGQRYIIRVSAEQDLNLGSESWHQTPAETHTVTLQQGVYTLQGADESVEIIVK